MSAPTANPLGAASDVTKAAVRIDAFLKQPEPQGQPAEKSVTVTANPETGEKVRNDRGQFSKTGEPETDIEDKSQKVEAEVETKGKTAEQSAPDDDSEELPEYLHDLAEKIGVDPDKFLDHVKTKVKVNGEEKVVNLKELAAGYQMQSDYQRKTAEIAEQRKATETERTAYQQQREHIASQLTPLVQQLEGLVQTDTQRIKQALDNGDYLEAQRIQFEATQRKEQLDIAHREQSRIADEQQRENRAKLEQHVAEQEAILLERKPEWKDTDKGRKELAEIRNYLKGEGVPSETADRLYEALPLLMADKARKWDEFQKNKPPPL